MTLVNTDMARKKVKNQRPNNNSEPAVIDFGTRKISNQNFSKIVTLPKIALKNFRGQEAKYVKIKMVFEDGEKILKLIPIYDLQMGDDCK